MVFSAAVALQQQEKRHARHWRVAEVQEAMRAVLTCMESAVFGPLMGYGSDQWFFPQLASPPCDPFFAKV
jgi:hypothetical protein